MLVKFGEELADCDFHLTPGTNKRARVLTHILAHTHTHTHTHIHVYSSPGVQLYYFLQSATYNPVSPNYRALGPRIGVVVELLNLIYVCMYVWEAKIYYILIGVFMAPVNVSL